MLIMRLSNLRVLTQIKLFIIFVTMMTLVSIKYHLYSNQKVQQITKAVSKIKHKDISKNIEFQN